MRRAIGLAMAMLFCAAMLATPAAAQDYRCANGRSKRGAMWLSIMHPGVGEYFLKGWGPWSNMPPRKFWLGFIPVFGWPGYLQVKSAVDAYHCETNDRLFGG